MDTFFIPQDAQVNREMLFADGGEMGRLMRRHDWAATALGPVAAWPQSLRTAVSVCLASHFPMLIWWGPELVKLYNDAYAPMLGTKHPWALGQRGRDCWPEIWDIIGPMLEGVLSRGQATWSENQLLLLERNGYAEECYFTFSYSPIRDETGGIGGVFTAVTETTKQVLGERRLRTLRTLSAAMVGAQAPEEVCQRAAEVLATNPADLPFALLYLLAPDGKQANLAATSHLRPSTPVAPTALQIADEGTLWPLETVARTGQPTLAEHLAGRLGEQAFAPLPTPQAALVLPISSGEEGRHAGFLVAGLSPRRPLDEEYQGFLRLVAEQAAKALATARAYQDAQERVEALAEIDRVKTVFFSNISHEFRTPLTLSLGPLDTLLSDTSLALTEPQRELLRIVQRNSMRQLKLVNTLLDFSRLEAGRIEATYEPVDLAALTTDLASSFRSAIEKAGMTLTVDCPPLDAPVYVDQQMWEKIVLNLLSNAFKYTFHGAITVRLKQTETTVEMTVADTGVGIPAEELPHIFERFHRVKGTAGRTFEGTGIGLSLVQELVKLHGGSIHVSSTLEQGSTFTVSLPLGSSHLPPERIAATRTLPSTAVSASRYAEEALQMLAGQEAVSALLPDMPFLAGESCPISGSPGEGEQIAVARILFADDNADMRDYVGRLLRPRYEVQVAPDGGTALAMVREYQPDLVLADVMMPGMDGFDLLQALRSKQESSTIPVILLSARAGEEAQMEGMAAGADDYLIKPFSARELLGRIGAHLEMVRLRAETVREVAAERERLYSLFQQAPAAIAVLEDRALRYELANPLYQQVFHRTAEQLIGKTMREVFPEVEGQGIFELLESVFATGVPYIANQFPATFDRWKTGVLETGYFNFIVQPLSNTAGKVDRLMIHAVEITEQIVARQRVEESEVRFRTLADNIPNLAWMARPDGWIYWYNSRWYAYTGMTPEQMEGWGWQAVHDPQMLPGVLQRWKQSLASREPFEMVFPLRGADGLFRPFLTRVAPVYDADGHLLRWFGTNTDITEQKRLEQQKDEFLGVASHELKTPVTSLKGYAQLLERRFRQNGDVRSADLLGKMDVQLNKLTSLVEDLLDVTKMESGRLLLHPSSFEMNALIAEVVEEVQRAASKHSIVLKLDAPVMLFADRDRIEQVLINLLTNAIKYSPRADTVFVKTVRTEDALITSVQDFGIGIPTEKQPYLFERFYRVEGESQLTYPGLGLGLYIAAEFVKRHRGSIWVESEPGRGTTVSFSLPLPQEPAESSGKADKDDETREEKNPDRR